MVLPGQAAEQAVTPVQVASTLLSPRTAMEAMVLWLVPATLTLIVELPLVRLPSAGDWIVRRGGAIVGVGEVVVVEVDEVVGVGEVVVVEVDEVVTVELVVPEVDEVVELEILKPARI
jgi:hypothetical protein